MVYFWKGGSRVMITFEIVCNSLLQPFPKTFVTENHVGMKLFVTCLFTKTTVIT